MSLNISLYNQDCLSVLKSLPANSIDMVLCDPPFGITDASWDKGLNWSELWPELKRACKNNAAICLFGSSKFTFELVASNKKDYRYRYVWLKNAASGFLNAKKMPLKRTEDICVFYQSLPIYNPQKIVTDKKPTVKKDIGPAKGDTLYKFKRPEKVRIYDNTRFPDDVLTFNAVPHSLRTHSSQKPTALLEFLIKTYTNEGHTVLDFCMGSGATGIAALNTKRAFIGCELDSDIFAKAKDWLDKHSALNSIT